MTQVVGFSNFVPFIFDRSSDLFWKDLFNTGADWLDANQKINYPVDIYQIKPDGELAIDIAAIGLDKSDIEIKVDGNVLSVMSKTKKETEDKSTIVQRNIVRKAFNYSWKINSKFDLEKMSAKLDKGLLKIVIPIAPDKTRLISIE